MPKSYKNLYPRVCAFENLYDAHRKARKGGKRRKAAAAEFEHNLGDSLLCLQEELLAQTYAPGPYHNFIYVERKERKISAAPYRDRVVHHALMNVVGPILEARHIADTYANRKRKGTHRAVDRAQEFARRYPYVLKCDVREFFPSIDLAILYDLLSRHVACRPTLGLIERILASSAGLLADRYTPVLFPGDDLFALARPRGPAKNDDAPAGLVGAGLVPARDRPAGASGRDARYRPTSCSSAASRAGEPLSAASAASSASSRRTRMRSRRVSTPSWTAAAKRVSERERVAITHLLSYNRLQ